MFKKEFLGTKIFVKIILINIIILFFIGIIFFVINPQEGGFGVLELILTILILSITTVYYKKYSDKNLLKRVKINSKPKINLKIDLFLIVFIFGMLIIIFYLFWIWLLQVNFAWFSENMFGTENTPILWSNFNFKLYFFYAIVQLVILISFGYLLNHFIKNANLIFGIIIIIGIYLMLFSTIFTSYIKMRKIDDFYYYAWTSDSNKFRILFNSFLFPWTSISIWGKNLFFVTNYDAPEKWFNLDHLNERGTTYSDFYKALFWTPYLFLFIYILIPNLNNYFSKNSF